jgi:hypothetical protein
MNRKSVALFSFILAIAGVTEARAQQACLMVIPDRAALLSDGTLGIAFGSGFGSTNRFDGVRPIDPSNQCFGQDAVEFMKRSCVSFLQRNGELPIPITSESNGVVQKPAQLSPEQCSAANSTIEQLVNENTRLKRAVRALRVRALRR